MKTRISLIVMISLSVVFLAGAFTQASVSQATPSSVAAPQALPAFTKIAAGASHTCGLTVGGGVKCWGENRYGQLGDGTTMQHSLPVDVVGLGSGVTALDAGYDHTCALTASGGVKCWGTNWAGELGDGTYNDSSTPVNVVGLGSGVTALATGGFYTCATTGGGVKCWGSNYNGQLGDGTTNDSTTPVDVVGLGSGVIALTAGGDIAAEEGHTCAVTAGGGAKCWGANRYGQLGDGTTTDRSAPVDVSGLSNGVMVVTSGVSHTCALTTGGGVKCWGSNNGRLGDGTDNDSSTPVDVVGLGSSVTALAAGWGHTCALTIGGGMKCWGGNSGQLGDGTTTNRSTPVDVIGLGNGVVALAAGSEHTCAVLDADHGSGVECWGRNESGQLGDGTVTWRSVPVYVNGLEIGATAVAAGWSHTCVLTLGGGVKCWGGGRGLGDGTISQSPADVSGLSNGATALAAGYGHTCVLTAGNGVKCWGKNSSGQLGDGTTTYRYTPVDVIGLSSGVAKLTLGWSHTCAVTVSGGAKCWGWNIYGQLGDGTTTNRNTPIDVSGLSSGVAALAGGQWHTCAVTAGGGVKCWGYNSRGQLGDGTTTKRSTPVDVTGLGSGVTALAAGGQHTCALTTNGGVKCWGANRYGQLGDGTNAGHYTPVAVSGLGSGVTALAAGEDYTCALTVSGGVKCWGANYAGELGDGTATDRNRPVTVSGLDSGATNLTAGREHACALVAGRTVCWGQDGSGQLGIGTILQRLTPVAVTNSAARVSLNYSSGKPGSYFSVTGENFPVSSTLTVTVNSAVLTTALRVNETGSFIFFLNTGGADAGAYTLMVDASLSSHSPLAADSTASAVFMLIPAAPLRVQEGGGATVSIPAGIARPLTYLYLPLIMR